MPMRRQAARRKLVMTSKQRALLRLGERSGSPSDNGTWRARCSCWLCMPQLTLYPPASFLAGLPGFEVVGVALAAPVHELAAALSVPAVVKSGDPGAAGPHLRGQEADLRVVSYGRDRESGRGKISHFPGEERFPRRRGPLRGEKVQTGAAGTWAK